MDSKVSAQAILINKEFKVQWFYESKVLINEHLYEAWHLPYDKQRNLIEFLSKNRLVTKCDIEIADFIGSPIFCELEDLRDILRLALEYLKKEEKKLAGLNYNEDSFTSGQEKELSDYLSNESTQQRQTQTEEIVASIRAKKIISHLDEARGFVHKNLNRVVGIKRERPDLERAIEVFENEVETSYAKSLRIFETKKSEIKEI